MRMGVQAWLQEFVWLEKSYAKHVQKRANYNPGKADILLKEPLFCFETSVRAKPFFCL